jgi:hypothetical protein
MVSAVEWLASCRQEERGSMPKPDVWKIVNDMESCVKMWHEDNGTEPAHDLKGLVGVSMDLCRSNYLLWHEEDEARREDVADEVIVRVKRSIDGLNQSRNDMIEKMDEVLLSQLHAEGVETSESAPMNTETAGSVFDRLSISVLRRYHLEEEVDREDADAAHIEKARGSVTRIIEQQNDLKGALDLLLDEIFAGTRRLKIYRQFKLYNDPELNPALYGK